MQYIIVISARDITNLISLLFLLLKSIDMLKFVILRDIFVLLR